MAAAHNTRLRKPLALYLVAGGYLWAMAVNIFAFYSHTRSLYPYDILFVILYPVAAYGIYKVRPWGWYLVVAHLVFLFIGNILLALKFGRLDQQMLIQLNVLLIFFLWFFLRSSVRSPFHNPALRWWERQHNRYGATFQVVLHNESGDAITADGVDLSMGGCFIKLAEDQNVALNDPVELELRYEDLEPFCTKGRIAWVTAASALNPKGAGVAFSRTDRANRLLLKGILRLAESRWLRSAENQRVPA